MICENKIEEYLNAIEEEKILIETHFANIEKILKNNKELNQEKIMGIMSNYNTLSIQYDQLCTDLITFLKIFKGKGQEIRVYKTEELVELLQEKVDQL